MSLLTRNKRFQNGKLVICIDIGTTFTAASYCIVGDDKEKQFKFQEVNRWPKQIYPDAKISSTIIYDRKGVARLHGAETEDTESLFQAEDNGWWKAEWWKLHLRPEYLPLPQGFRTKALPPLVTVDQTFEDQFRYVLKNVQAFIVKTLGDPKYWGPLSTSMFVVLTTPNGWEGRQQNKMRNAAIKAGLISSETKNRLRFVSEGEAAVHYCLDHVPIHSLQIGGTVLVCDAGGGTTDIGVYRVIRLDPIYLEEILSPRCIVTGGVYVDHAAREFIEGRLEGSQWRSEEIIAKVTRVFEKEGKRGFTGNEESVYLTLGESGRSDDARGVVRGRLKITRNEMIDLFEPSIKRLTDGLQEVFSESPYLINQIFVVGGFAESNYVYSKIATFVQTHLGIPTAKPDGVLSKAIAHGGLNWHFDSSIQIRMTRLHYGAETNIAFRHGDKDMAGREKYQNVKGEWRVRNAWKCIVPKNTRLRTGREHREIFHLDVDHTYDLEVEMELYAYRLQDPPVFFKDKDGNLIDGFVHLGTVKADLTQCYNAMKFRTSTGPFRKRYKTLEYEVGLKFGDIEISASLHWKENGVSVSGQATIAYDL